MSQMNKHGLGNSAEYLVCYELQRNSIPVWQLGGNNKRWDIVFQIGEDEFVPGQVKARTQSTISFKTEDLKPSKGYYFIYFCPDLSTHSNSLRLAKQLMRITDEKLGSPTASTLLIYSSDKVLGMLERAQGRSSNVGKASLITNLTEQDIYAGLDGRLTFFQLYGRK